MLLYFRVIISFLTLNICILDLMCTEIKDCSNEEEAVKGIRTALMSKAYGNEDFLAHLIAKACSTYI